MTTWNLFVLYDKKSKILLLIMAMSSMCPSSNRSQVRTNKKDRIQLIMKEHPLPDLDMLDQYSNMVTILLLCSLKKKKKVTGKAFMY